MMRPIHEAEITLWVHVLYFAAARTLPDTAVLLNGGLA
jgi:hypothetical protein